MLRAPGSSIRPFSSFCPNSRSSSLITLQASRQQQLDALRFCFPSDCGEYDRGLAVFDEILVIGYMRALLPTREHGRMLHVISTW